MCAGSAVASTGYVQVKEAPGIKMRLGDMSDLMFRDNPPNFQGADLRDAAARIQADVAGAGVVLDGHINVFFATVSEGSGPGGALPGPIVSNSLVTMIDHNFLLGNVQHDTELLFHSAINDGQGDYINDLGDNVSAPAAGGSMGGQFSEGEFKWDAVERGDGQAWLDIEDRDRARYEFIDETGNFSGAAAAGNNLIQFFTYSTTLGAWKLAGTMDFLSGYSSSYYGPGGSGNGQYYTLDVVIPLPGPAAMGLAGLMGLGVIRRRAR
jgi:hypothetical protein